jgi:hypothetical protein
MFTASELQELLGAPGGLKALVSKKLSGVTNDLSHVKAIQWGVTYEPVACALYESRNGCRVFEFGLLPHPRIPRFGASPDGITEQGIMLEIKCPYTRVIDGRVSRTYMTQMQTQLDTAGLAECDFLECKFYEYDGVEEYVQDVHINDPSMAACGMEKGAVLGEEVILEDAAGRALEGYRRMGEGARLWRVDVYNCQRVSRDPAFMPSIERVVREAGAKLDEAEKRGLEAVDFGGGGGAAGAHCHCPFIEDA